MIFIGILSISKPITLWLICVKEIAIVATHSQQSNLSPQFPARAVGNISKIAVFTFDYWNISHH